MKLSLFIISLLISGIVFSQQDKTNKVKEELKQL